jgi:NAD(P)-dependent dehydrogenase (short-subunit alcohol dehydrogenase family)
MRTIVGKGAIITGGTSGIGARAAGCVSRRQERGFVAPLAINASEVLRGEKRRLIEFDQPASRLFEAGWHCVKPTPFS